MHLARLGLLLAVWTSACDGSDPGDRCVPIPAACASTPSCDCLPPASDPDFGDAQCVDDGVCEDVEGGAVVTCDDVDWGCG